jgi:hypothetical protein
MKNLHVTNIPENKYNFFVELVNNLGFRVDEKREKKLTPQQQELVDDIKYGLKQVDDYLEGKIKLKPAKDLLNEL